MDQAPTLDVLTLHQALAGLLRAVDAQLLQYPRLVDAATTAQTAFHTSVTQAQAAREIDQQIQLICYELAAWAHLRLYRMPWMPGSIAPSDAEVVAYLRELRSLTERGAALAETMEERRQ
jgi:hypothetical protein